MVRLVRHIPNFITCLNAFSGCLACSFAIEGEYVYAACFIALAAIFDFFDGFAARLLKAYSPMGKELDSLSDAISFGMAPALMVFHYMQAGSSCVFSESLNRLMAYAAFLLVVFSVLRLAKFNIDERQTTSFIGLAVPANALFWAFGLAYSFDWLGIGPSVDTLYILVGLLLFSFLLVSNIPMFSLKFKHYRWRGNGVRYVFLVACILLLSAFGLSGISACILWYILLSLISCCKLFSK